MAKCAMLKVGVDATKIENVKFENICNEDAPYGIKGGRLCKQHFIELIESTHKIYEEEAKFVKDVNHLKEQGYTEESAIDFILNGKKSHVDKPKPIDIGNTGIA